ncbi:MAG: TolC family protein, partial [Betaproteobacteria bacterium]
MSAVRKAGRPRALAVALACALWLGATPARAQPTPPADLGRSLAGVLEYARQRHPELRALRHEADAARERIVPAGALPDPMFQVELRDVTNEMSGGSFNLLPARVGSTRYQLRQSLPAWGRREARRAVA